MSSQRINQYCGEKSFSLRSKDHNTTFKQNKQKPVHRWFSYVEGFSGDFVQKIMKEFEIKSDSVILDPFSGSGTTFVESSLAGIQSYGYEINPFLTFTSKTKTNFSLSPKKLQCELLIFNKKIKNYSKFDSSAKDVGLSELFANNVFFWKKNIAKSFIHETISFFNTRQGNSRFLHTCILLHLN